MSNFKILMFKLIYAPSTITQEKQWVRFEDFTRTGLGKYLMLSEE
ncbi:hypothetical protein BN59_01096 [Legionella massiliensis]|uniref:Uncharacterized protein n=1 Tax=Legionella massiliensis TaxID=1034943 RepID=A0A078KQY0_9GAMM|nr:hypothetical protein BN59_01096 [Legionella massiliensis]CEE12558.1 hypothetical protein BN1094_01096 [Legionella massiliensis]